MSRYNGFGECTVCKVWADIPDNFNEGKHFLKCPKCGEAMFLSLGFDPVKDLAYQMKNKVTVTEFIKHKG